MIPGCPICPACGERGLHGSSDGCLETLRAAIAQYARRPETPLVGARRTRSPQFLRRDRCDLPPTDITKTIP